MPVPVPVSAILKGLLLGSVFAMCSTAVFRPVLTGKNRTVKLVLPPGTSRTGVGLVTTVNMAESVPLMVIFETVRFALPVFVMVKVRLVLVPTATKPKLLVPTPLTRFVPRGC